MKNLIIICVIFYCVKSGLAQASFPRPCPEHPVHEGFLPNSYAGYWYEVHRYDTATQSAGDCVISTYSMFTNMIFNVQYQMIVNLQTNPFDVTINGQSFVSFPEDDPLPGRMNLTFTGTPALSNYWILDTDYDNYSVVWYCENITPTSSTETAWVLSRTPQMNPQVQSDVDQIIDTFLDRNYLYNTVQDSALCTNWPTSN